MKDENAPPQKLLGNQKIEVRPRRIAEQFQEIEVSPRQIDVEFQEIEVSPCRIAEQFQEIEVNPSLIEVNLYRIAVEFQEIGSLTIFVESMKTFLLTPRFIAGIRNH